MTRLLALAALLAMPAVALAQPIRISNTDTIKLGWPSIAGVTSYESKLVYADGTESEPVASVEPRRHFTPRKSIPFVVVARVCSSGVCEGPWSDPGSEFILCLMSDLNCDGGVGLGDFRIFLGDWGTTVDE
jgi:hypothetical protein